MATMTMLETKVDTEYWTCSPTVILRMGAENIRDPHTAFIELVRNSYDADATFVTIRFRESKEAGSTIEIHDNGVGMDRDEIRRWFRPGGESKVTAPYTGKGRRKLGAKGIGRLSAAKLGRTLRVQTRPSGVRHHYECRQTLILGTQAVRDPRTDTGEPHSRCPGVHHE